MKFRPNADMMASVLVHLLLLALIFLYSEVHQFDPVAADTVPVEVVTPQEVAEIKPDPTPSPSPTPEFQLPSLDKQAEAAKPEPAAQPTAPQPQQPEQKQATPPPAPKPSPTPQRSAAAEPPPAPPQPQTPPAAQPQQPPPPSPPAYKPPEPDLSVKYHVMLGLPPDLSVPKPSAAAPSNNDGGKDSFDAPATEKADIGSSVVAEFRRHLKSCMKLPPQLTTGDDVRVKLRVFMKPDGKLAAAPQLIEASASAKGPLLLQSATNALQACQPYAMLPKDRYGEWKVLDLDFAPRDFAS
ncbi:hypothetical protein [Bradyrhizobium sp. CCBAU 51753]|uniref:hypothetical protein n=1 Tax=Bradyrhizobium sp. CCBAU 51753 TaxID=1325100 RepID=UPI00188B3EC5|nr:hypothetical protein [Bradyrhizobium sp. CCBAU 51753]QOZ26445.1 hypothetical protein XH93_24705 [Bradyrhizobium sp. CCBAU 51753]